MKTIKTALAGALAGALLAGGAGPTAMAQPGPAAQAALPADVAAYPRLRPDTRPLQYGRFTVEVVGHGPDVILIPGLNSSRETYRDLIPALRGHYRLHLIQVAGFAGAPAGDNASGPVFAPLVEAIDQYIRDKGLKKPAVIGHSMGGELALALAARHPDDIGRVMAVDSLPWLGALFGAQQVDDRLRGMAKGIATQMAGSNDNGWQAGAVANTAPLLSPGADQRMAVGWSLSSDRRVSAQSFSDLITTDLRPELAAISAPTTILYAHGPQYGAQTPEQTDAFVEKLYAGLNGGRLVRIMPSHHFIMFDQPARFRSEVELFLKR